MESKMEAKIDESEKLSAMDSRVRTPPMETYVQQQEPTPVVISPIETPCPQVSLARNVTETEKLNSNCKSSVDSIAREEVKVQSPNRNLRDSVVSK